MTQYKDVVERRRDEIVFEKKYKEWCNRPKYLHAHDGIIELALNDGRVIVETPSTKEKIVKYPSDFSSDERQSVLKTKFEKIYSKQ